MGIQTDLTRLLGIEHPIIQAPMAGGATTVELVAAVGEAGGLGFFGVAYDSPQRIAELAARLRATSDRPFGINLFAPQDRPETKDHRPMIEAIAAYHEELGLPPPTPPEWTGDSFSERFEPALASGASVLSFTFGMLPEEAVAAARQRGMLVIGTATTVAEAMALERSGVDAVTVQGSEAGAHRGTFAGEFADSLIGTISLVPQVVDAVGIPVIASGGIMDGRGIAAALALGAAGVQMGTAFLTCPEAGIPHAHKEAILAATEDSTRITRAFSGRPARGIVNRFMREVEIADGGSRLLPFPLQNSLTRTVRKAAAEQGDPEFLSLWAGQGVRMSRTLPAGMLVERLAAELEETIARMSDHTTNAMRGDHAGRSEG